jgi:mgtE-like transporter
MLHLGLIRPQIKDNTPVFRQLVGSIFVISLIDTLLMGAFSYILNVTTGVVTLNHLWIFVIVPPIACVLALAISIPITILIASTTFRKGLDPDILVYPILASVNDIIVTTTFVATVMLVLHGGIAHLFLGLLFTTIIGVAVVIIWRSRSVRFFFQTIQEGTTIVIMSSLFGSFNGVFLSGMSRNLSQYPSILAVYPALTNALGNIGSIIGSTKTTSLALGFTRVRGFVGELKDSMSLILQIESVALLIHAVFGVVAYLIVRPGVPRVSLSTIIEVTLLSNLLSFLPIALFALVVAHQAFKLGLNPDNVAIPVITSVSDTVATVTLFLTISILSFLGIL